MLWQSLRSHSFNRDITNNPNTVKSHSATEISHSCIFQVSVHGRKERVQRVFQGIYIQNRETNPCVEHSLAYCRTLDVIEAGVSAHSMTLICEIANQRS